MIRIYQMENESDIQDIPESYAKYMKKSFAFNIDTIQQTFFDDLLSPFAIPSVNVVFCCSEEIYCDFFKLSAKLYGHSNGCKIGTIEYRHVSSEEAPLTNSNTDDGSDCLSPIEKAKVKKAEEYYYEKSSYEDPEATPKNALNILHPVFLNHKNKEYVLSVYLPIYITANIDTPMDVVEKFLGNLDKGFISVQLAYIDLYLINQKLEKAENLASKLLAANGDNALVKSRYILVLLAAWRKYNSDDFLKSAITCCNSLTCGKDILENSWVQRIKYLVKLRQGGKMLSNAEEYPENAYKNFMKGGVLSVGYSVFDEYSSIQDAITNAAENETIYISKGVYRESFAIGKKVKLVGDQTVIVIPSDETCVVKSDAVIKNIVFTNKDYASYSEVTEALKDSNAVRPDENMAASCALMDISGKPTITGCVFMNGFGGAVKLSNSACAKLDNTVVSNNLKWGIFASDESKITVKDCQLKNNKSGVEVCKKACSDIYNSEFVNNDEVAVKFSDEAKGRVDKCTFSFTAENTASKPVGIAIKDSASPSFLNSCIEGCYNGMVVQNSGKPTVEDCQFVKNRKNGLLIEDNAAGVFSKCSFTENSSLNGSDAIEEDDEAAGIKLDSVCTEGLQIEDCTISENATGILVEDGIPQIEACVIRDNLIAGIKCSSGNPIVRELTLSGNKKIGMWITGGAAGKYAGYDVSYDNKLKTTSTSQIGILVEGKAKPLFKEGSVHDNYRAGIFREDSFVKVSEIMDVFSNVKGIDGNKKQLEGENFIRTHGNADVSISSIKAKLFGGK